MYLIIRGFLWKDFIYFIDNMLDFEESSIGVFF